MAMTPRVMLWANYRRGPNISVPSPHDGDLTIPWFYDRIASWAQHWAEIGITDVLFPGVLKTNAGDYPGADGYGVWDDYDIGSKDTPQFGGKPTRFGDVDKLLRAIAVCKANGLNVLLDHVMHQRSGGRDGIYNYVGSDGHTLNGRFPKIPSYFRGVPPRVPQDNVPAPGDDFNFGDEFSPVNAEPKMPDGHSVVWHELLNAGDWLFHRTGADGARLDDMKGLNIDFMKAFMRYGAMQGKYFFGEYASGNRDDLNWWVAQIADLSSAADFDFHYNMARDMAELSSHGYDMRGLHGRGMVGNNPMKAVPFVESMDSDVNGFATIVDNKILCYALLLTGEGLPQIYIRDYLREPDCYGEQVAIDNLIWCHTNLIYGDTKFHWTPDSHIYAIERLGGNGRPNTLIILNNDVWNPQWHVVTLNLSFGANVEIKDYTGKNDANYWTDQNGQVTVWVPPGANGTGYGVWSVVGINTQAQVIEKTCTQTFFGDIDLDILPLGINPITVGKIWCRMDTQVKFELIAEFMDYVITLQATDGTIIKTPYDIPHTAYYDIIITPTIANVVANIPFALKVHYHASKQLTVDQY